MLVLRGLTKKVVLTRLPVGHTHEDIDGRFGVIWLSMRCCHVLSPQEYEQVIKGAFGKSVPVKVKDIWVVPDYRCLCNSIRVLSL